MNRVIRNVPLVSIQKLRAPKLMITKEIVLRVVTARERKPLHVVSHPDVVVGRIIQAGMRGDSGTIVARCGGNSFAVAH